MSAAAYPLSISQLWPTPKTISFIQDGSFEAPALVKEVLKKGVLKVVEDMTPASLQSSPPRRKGNW